MRRYSKFSGLLTTYKKSFSDNFKKMSDKQDYKQDKDLKNESFLHGLSDKFTMVTHKVSNTFDWISKTLGFKRNESIQNTQNTKANNEFTKDKPKFDNDSRNPNTQCKGPDTTFDINKMGGGTMQGQSRAEEHNTKPQSKLDLKFGAGSSYGSSGIGKNSEEKASGKIPQDEKRTYSPEIQIDSEASKPENETVKDAKNNKEK